MKTKGYIQPIAETADLWQQLAQAKADRNFVLVGKLSADIRTKTQRVARDGRLVKMAEDRMLKWFHYEHLPEHLRAVSMPFGELAQHIVDTIDVGPERTVALRKLLEAKDAAVRAVVSPGG